jgi:hypothetical protein
VATTATCLYCGTTFTAKRRSAKFCSDSCRVSQHRLGRSGLSEEQLFELEYGEGALREFQEWERERREQLSREIAALNKELPFHVDAKIEAAVNRYWDERHRWRPKRLG